MTWTSNIEEQPRSDRRTEIRRKLAAAEIATGRWQQLSDAIAATERRKDEIANEHVAAARPIQTAIAELDRRLVDLVVAKSPPDPALESQRQELAEQVRQLNLKLERDLEDQDRLIHTLSWERREVGLQTSTSELTNELVQLADEPTRIALRIANDRAQRCASRFSSICNDLAGIRKPTVWQLAVLEDAEKETTAAQELAAAALKAAIGEE